MLIFREGTDLVIRQAVVNTAHESSFQKDLSDRVGRGTLLDGPLQAFAAVVAADGEVDETFFHSRISGLQNIRVLLLVHNSCVHGRVVLVDLAAHLLGL